MRAASASFVALRWGATMFRAAYLTSFLLLLSVNAYAQNKETHITEKDGSKTVVRTDDKGTIVTNDGKALYTAGGDRHKEQVDHSTRHGGAVTKDSSKDHSKEQSKDKK